MGSPLESLATRNLQPGKTMRVPDVPSRIARIWSGAPMTRSPLPWHSAAVTQVLRPTVLLTANGKRRLTSSTWPASLVTRGGLCALVLLTTAVFAGFASGDVVRVLANRFVRFADLSRGLVRGILRDVRPNSRIVGNFGRYHVAIGPTRNGNFCEAVGTTKELREIIEVDRDLGMIEPKVRLVDGKCSSHQQLGLRKTIRIPEQLGEVVHTIGHYWIVGPEVLFSNGE